MLTRIKKIEAPYCLYIMFVFGFLPASCETCLLGTIITECVSMMRYQSKTFRYLTYVPLPCPKQKSYAFLVPPSHFLFVMINRLRQLVLIKCKKKKEHLKTNQSSKIGQSFGVIKFEFCKLTFCVLKAFCICGL